MLDKIDFVWSLVLLVVALMGVWKTWVHRNRYWKVWPWHAAACIAWLLSIPLNFATGDKVFAWFGFLLASLEGWNWITQQDKAKTEFAKAVEREEREREMFESLRIDDLPKN